LPRKHAKTVGRPCQPALHIATIEFVGQKPACCIAVSHPSHLYLTSDYVVTHNTAIANSIVLQALKHVEVGIFNFEMGIDELSGRLLSANTHVDAGKFRSPWDMDQLDIDRLREAATLFADREKYKRLHISDTMTNDFHQVANACREMARQGVGLFAIDYLSLLTMNTGRSSSNRQEEVSAISRSLKMLARELDVPFLVLAQLNRQSENRTNKTPAISDLRESGQIEQDADVIILLHPQEEPEGAAEDADPNRPVLVDAILGKQRSGPTGTVTLQFVKRYTQYMSRPHDGDERRRRARAAHSPCSASPTSRRGGRKRPLPAGDPARGTREPHDLGNVRQGVHQAVESAHLQQGSKRCRTPIAVSVLVRSR
jgi:replicative DNA helicase